ncbi:hypothetical protein ACWGI8_30040 [Streptomyces sp. NPDC054841]
MSTAEEKTVVITGASSFRRRRRSTSRPVGPGGLGPLVAGVMEWGP